MNNHQTVSLGHGWLTANLVFQVAFGLLAMTICLPSMQEWPAILGAGQAEVQLTFSGFVAAYGGLQLVYGPLSDRIGRKPVLLLGLALAGAGSLLAAFAPDLPLLIVARVLQGAGSAAGTVVGRAMVQDLYGGHERTRMMALIGMTMGVCPPLGTLVGGQLHARFGWQANFALTAALALALLLAGWWGIPDAKLQGASRPGAWRELYLGYVRLAREPAFLLYVVILATATATFYTFLGGAPLVLASYGVAPERMGWYIMCPPIAYIFGNLLTTRLIRRLGDRRIMYRGQAATVCGIVLVLVLGLAGLHTPLALALPLMLLGIGHGLLAPPSLTGTVGLVPALAGSAAAVAGLMQQLTGALGGFLVGLVSHHGPVNLALMMLGWTLAGLAAQVVLYRFVLRR
ncbi:MAG TPA: Bcr/CflA family efflux MFS transporter [Ramlibacter sp.]|nr:Bcr/CflA family efflux MFS transporter [Ramlibacter sp.]